jgi:two-component system LytT family sensor kinase
VETLAGAQIDSRARGADAVARDSPRRRLTWVLVVGFWAFFAVLNASQLYLGMRAEGMSHSFGRVLAWQVLGWAPWACLTPLVLWLGRRFPVERSALARSLPAHALSCALLAAAHIAAFTYVTILLTPFGAPPPGRSFLSLFYGRLTSQFHIDLVIYCAILGVSYAVGYYGRFREREMRASQLEAQLAQAELQALRMQLQPHFLFNTLNGIAGLVRDQKNRAAVDMLAGLSDLLRYTLVNAGRQEVPLREELEFLELYLRIQQMRFPDRLRVETHVAADALDALVPNLILQPLVENAIRHGIAPRAAAGTVGVSAARRDGTLELKVYDDGLGLKPRGDAGGNAGEGIGLANTRARLRQLYGARQRFTVENREPQGVEATLVIPFARRDEDGGDA